MGFIFGHNERLLTPQESHLIRRVFRTTRLPNLGRIRIRDGLSVTGTPFAAPRERVVVQQGFPFTTEGEYLIMVGKRLFDGDVAVMEPDTLVHEVTHVWQYKHGTLGEYEGAFKHIGAAAIRRTDHLYEYEIGESWDDMGFEGQAQLVQEWFTLDNMSETSDRWVYVKHVLMLGDVRARSLTLGQLRLENPELPSEDIAPIREVSFGEYPFNDGYLQTVLDTVIPPTDVKGLASRVQNLDTYFRQLRRVRPHDAATLAGRLQARKRGDKLAEAFHYRLMTSTRERLVKVLQGLA